MLCYLKLVGTDGLCKSAEFFIKQGDSAFVGRSQSCQISLGKLARFKELDEEKDKVALTKFRTVDGQHLKIYFKSPDHIMLEDMSDNGTFLDGEKVQGQVIISSLQKKPATLLLGLEERFRMELLQEASDEQLEKKAVPTAVDEDGRPRTDEIVNEGLEQ